jgi:ribosomal 50S subunit-associated protein YjgA (DUF615 family)
VNRNVVISFGFHTLLVVITAMSLPFLTQKPIDLPPIISVELIQISDKTNIPFAPKAKKIIEKVKEKEKKLISEQAPPKKIKKTKTKTVVSLDKKIEKIDKQKPESLPLPEKTVKKIETKKETKQNPEKVVTEVKQVSEFEKKDIFDPSDIAALIDKSKVESAKTNKKLDKITQDQDKEMDFSGLTLSEEDALKAQIFGCWSIPLGLPFNEDLLVRIKLQLKPDGSIIKTEMLDHARMNKPGQGFYKALAESVLRAVRVCEPLRVPSTGYERWKDILFNFDAREMLEG